jgi:hypothetical protein
MIRDHLIFYSAADEKKTLHAAIRRAGESPLNPDTGTRITNRSEHPFGMTDIPLFFRQICVRESPGHRTGKRLIITASIIH